MRSEPAALERISALPTGTVTFLFTDIEGSAQRWERHREEMKAALARHEQLISSAIKRHGGYVFKTLGDAFCAAFSTAQGAAAAAVDAQLALAKEDFASVDGLRVRMGLHTGYAEERNADYFGPAVNRVARLMSIGHGGQILLSGVTRDLAHSDLPAGVSLVDLGSHRLKDLTEAEQVWQLSIEGLPAEFPSLKSLDTLTNNLPVEVTSFRGREHDVDQLKKLLADHRLLTLTGAGGIGKTRLAVHVGADVLEQFPDGVWVADLAPITDPELVSSVVAKVIGVNQVEGRRVDESIPQWLKRKNLLLILDNCEHLLGAVAVLVDAIHRSCPNVRVLATSRQALGISGEAVHRLPSLAVPEPGSTLGAEDALRYSAIALFVDRAVLVDTQFLLSDESAPTVADICRRLDGIPLAIELAAARVKVLSVPNLAQRLNERFTLLTGGSRTALPRQKTLGALIDWSYDLLSPKEQLLFNRVGIFAGGFSLDAVTAVCVGESLDEIDVLDLLSSLTDKSLVVADTTGETARYHLLESTRAYALEKLKGAGEFERLAGSHAAYFRDQAQAADERSGASSTYTWLAQVEQEQDNYRAALQWAVGEGCSAVVGGEIAGALQSLWQAGLNVEGRYWIGMALKLLREAEHPKVAARLWQATSRLSSGNVSYEAARHARDLYQSVGDNDWAALAQSTIAFALYQMGRCEEAEQEIAQAFDTLTKLGDAEGVAYALNVRAIVAMTSDTEKARELYAQALAAFRSLGNETGEVIVLGNLAQLEFAAGRLDEAVRLASEAHVISSRGRESRLLITTNSNLATFRIALGELGSAREFAVEALRLARNAQSSLDVPFSLQHLSLIGALSGQAKAAARVVGYVDAQFKALGYERGPTGKKVYDPLLVALRERLSEAEIANLAAEGGEWSEDQAVEEALKL